jgi:threonyl-tRNA synthetase
MPRGAIVRGILETFIKEELIKRGYQPVYTPHIGRLEMYRTSGHFPYYRDAQYPPVYFHPAAFALDLAYYRLSAGELDEKKERELADYFKLANFHLKGYDDVHTNEQKLNVVHQGVLSLLSVFQDLKIPAYHQAKDCPERAKALGEWLGNQEGYLIKPMNCPHHIQIYKAQQHSYRDLPIRLAEFGTVYRFEQTGELSGMTRVRGFTQDDAHLFIRPDQVESEMRANIELVLFVLSSLGLKDYRVRIGLRDPSSSKYVGAPEDWDAAEKTLVDIVKNLGMSFTAEQGEAAFYGPKIDFVVRDCIGREWQLGTVQLDYNLPKRFELEYIGADNTAHRPVMIHRAPFGSMERFMGILIEHFAGAFPLWLAPEQVRVLTVSEKFTEYAQKVEKELKDHGFRTHGDYRPEKIGFKIREAQLDKVPYMLVIGDKEQSSGTVAIRHRSEGDQGALTIADLIGRLQKEVQEKRL